MYRVVFLMASFFFCIGSMVGYSQAIVPEGKFLTRNARIGDEIAYSLSVRYPRELNLIFPDSTYEYLPFEIVRREYFETVSDSLVSFDSTVYYLSTFEIDSVQVLQLPVFVLSLGDCTAVYPEPDSIILTEVIDQMPQQPELKFDTSFWNIKRAFNYPLLGVIAAIFLIAGLLIFMIFGKKIKKTWETIKLRRAHKRFTTRFFNLMRNVSGNNPSKSPEFVLAVWKRYMERLEGVPISKLTTKEINKVHPDPMLKEHLRSIDRIIYGDERKTDLFASLDFLLKFAVVKYQERIEGLKHN